MKSFKPSIGFAKVTSNTAPYKYWEMNISDSLSNTLVCKIKLTGEELAEMLSATYLSQTKYSGEILDNQAAERIGKKRVTIKMSVDYSYTNENSLRNSAMQNAAQIIREWEETGTPELSGWQFDKHCMNTRGFTTTENGKPVMNLVFEKWE